MNTNNQTSACCTRADPVPGGNMGPEQMGLTPGVAGTFAEDTVQCVP